jgi:hypothetical protein
MTTPASTSFAGSAAVCGPCDMYPGGRTVQTAISCPDCSVPAEIAERFSLPSTDGAVDHIVLRCAAGHCFRMATDLLPSQQRQQLATQKPAA